jgi:hypothetical protein
VHYGAPRLNLQDHTWTVFAIATISGWISAFLGAWKDAPVEGFQPLKFVRSPLWSGFWGLLLAHFNLSILVVMMAGLGFTIFTLETYKTFFFPVEAPRQVCRQADPVSGHASPASTVHRALCGDLAVRAGRLLAGPDQSPHGPRFNSLGCERDAFRTGRATEPSLSDARDRHGVVALVGAGVLWFALPDRRPLVGYFLYAIPAHLLISVLANEPALFAAAKVAPPAWVAIAGTAGCVVAAILDYALIGWFVNHRLIKTELDDSRGFQVAQRFFARAPFC